MGISTEYDCHLNVSTSQFVGCEGSDGGTGEALGGCEESDGGTGEALRGCEEARGGSEE